MTRPAIHLVVPGAFGQRTGGYGYDRRIVEHLRASGREVVVHELAGRFPLADDVARMAAAASLERMRRGCLPVIDGLALPAFRDLAADLPSPWVALVHHPLALETGLAPDAADALFELERSLLPRATRIVVTSPRTRRDLEAYDVPAERVAVLPPGTDPAPLARGSGGPTLDLLCVAALTPRKGHLVLVEALAMLADLDWRLMCVGSLERDAPHAATVAELVRSRGLHGRVVLLGERDETELDRAFDAADAFVLASHHEGYGMVLAEALARGLPVVATEAGAIPDTVPPGGGLLVPPGDVAALAAVLRRIMSEPGLRRRLAGGAREARRRLPSWADAGRRFAAELDVVAIRAGFRPGVASTT